MRQVALIGLVLLAVGGVGCGGEGKASISMANQGRPMPEVLKGVHRVLFYGDSLTDGSDYPDYVVNTLNREFPDVGFVVLNSGRCGDDSGDLIKRLKADVLDRRPDLVTICVGTNDSSQHRPVETFHKEMGEVVSTIQKSGAKVILLLTTPFRDPNKEAQLQPFLAALKDVAKTTGCTLCDAHGLFLRGIADGKQMLGPDGAHHGPDGFVGMARAILDTMGLEGVEIDRKIRPWPGTLTKWEMSEPVTTKGGRPPMDANLAKDFRPWEPEKFAGGLGWSESPFIQRGAFMPHEGKKGKTFVFGRAVYRAEKAGPAELQIGGSYPMVAWFNGRQVFEGKGGAAHGYHPNADRLRVELRKGENEVLFATNWMAFAGIVPADK